MVSTLSLTLVSFLKCINLITLRQGSDAVLHMFMLTSCSRTFQLTAVKHKNRESSGGIAIEQAKNCSGVVLILSPPPL